MPEMQPSMNTSASQMPVVMEVPSIDDDYALGCECADPALQIERWMQEASGDAAA
jgi:hypothetical protein